jgi:hypothetical protein
VAMYSQIGECFMPMWLLRLSCVAYKFGKVKE